MESGGIKEVGGAFPSSPHNGCNHYGCPGIFVAPSLLHGMHIFDNGVAFND